MMSFDRLSTAIDIDKESEAIIHEFEVSEPHSVRTIIS